jgi:hypothetical protein
MRSRSLLVAYASAIRFSADDDNFNQANRRYFCQARVTTD